MDQDKIEKICIGVGCFGLGVGTGALILRPQFKKLLTMSKLSSQLLQWGVDNGIRMPTVELDHQLYEKISFIGIAARGIK